MNINKKTNYIGIVIFGEMATGKDTLADYLIETNPKCEKYNIGNAVRQFLSIIKVNPDLRGKDRLFSQSIADKLREVHPEILNDYCLSIIYEKWQKEFKWNNDKISNDNFYDVLLSQLTMIKQKEIPIIVGGRTYVDFEYWSRKHFLPVGIVCDFNIRYERLRVRDGDEIARNSNFSHNTEVNVGDIARNKCAFIIDNNKDFQYLNKQADSLLSLII